MPERIAVGVDVGGTKVAAGLVNSQGCMLFQTRVPMASSGDAAAGFGAVRAAVAAVFAAHPESRSAIRGIGIGSPGPLDPTGGIVIHPRNLPCWRNFPLTAEVERAFGVPARLDNDANAAALGEALWGAGAGYRNLFYVTIGTGIGTALILDRRIYHGRTGNAAEGGHVTMDFNGPPCNCGKRGCFEAFCSGPAIARRAQARLSEANSPPSVMREMVGEKLEEVRAETVAEALAQGDPVAKQVLEETADLISVWLGNMVDLLEPEVIVLGGGVSGMLSAFLERMREGMPRWSINPRCSEIPLVLAKYGADSGVVGAAALVLA